MSARQEDRSRLSDEPALDAAITDLLHDPTRGTASEPVSSATPQADVSDLADACIEQVARLDRWDADTGSLNEEQAEEEMDRWGAVFRRAIEKPSAGLRDLAGKAHLMLADLDRFHPLEEYSSDDFRLMRVILAETIAFGGLTGLPSGTRDFATADTDLLALRQSFDAAHTAWLEAVAENDEPAERCNAHIKAAVARGVAVYPAYKEAWALPGVKVANDREESTYSVVADLAMKALRLRPKTLAGLALQARAVTPLIWIDGEYEKDAALGEGEDLGKEAVRHLIESVLALSEAASTITPTSFDRDASASPGRGDHRLYKAIDAHRRAHIALIDAAVAADSVHIRQQGGDTSFAALGPLEAASKAAGLSELQAWRDVFRVRPDTVNGLLALLRHTSEHYEGNHGIADAPDVFGALIGAVEGLRIARLARPAEHHLSLLSIAELEQLARIANREREVLMAVESQGFCWSKDRESFSALGQIIEAEGERMAFLGDHAVHEIERRRPTEKDEINLRLEALVRHHLNCNGYIEPELMTEVIQAWGRA